MLQILQLYRAVLSSGLSSSDSPSLAEAVQLQHRKQGIAAELEQCRGLDHGVFVSLMLMYPHTGIPCIQVSLQQSLNPLAHLQLGQALAALD